MKDPSQVAIRTIGKRIDRILRGLLRREDQRFKCHLVLLYVRDHLSDYLEPEFVVPGPNYNDRPSLPIESEPKFFASIVYQSRHMDYSITPTRDIRLKGEAQDVIRQYQIPGSLIGYPLLPYVTGDSNNIPEPLGVLVLCTDEQLRVFKPQETIEPISNNLLQLTALLLLREERRASAIANNYEKLTEEVFRRFRPICNQIEALKLFEQSCVTFLNANRPVIIDVQRLTQNGTHCAHFHRPSNIQIQQGVKDILDQKSIIVLNRRTQDTHLYDTFQGIVPDHIHARPRAWSGFVKNEADIKTYCLIQRSVDSFADHWKPHEMSFLDRSAELLHLLLKRSDDFHTMLNQISLDADPGIAQPHPFSRPQFDLICHVCRNFLDADQVLLTRITREKTCYHISGVFASGFGDNDSWLVERTDRKLEKTNTQDVKLDVLPHILKAHLRRKSRRAYYFSKVDDPDCDYFIDAEVRQKCELKGNLLFLPCVTTSDDGEVTLRSILHLGNAEGALGFRDEVKPFLDKVAASVAAGMQRREREMCDVVLHRILSRDDLSPATLHQTAKDVADLCRSVGGTVFVRVTLLGVVGFERVNLDSVEMSVGKVIRSQARAQWSSSDAQSKRFAEMLSSFLGINRSQLRRYIKDNHSDAIAKIFANSLYICVARSGEEIQRNYFAQMFDRLACEYDDAKRVTETLCFLTSYCYVPGHGLTGWVLRYKCNMLLQNKQSRTIMKFFESSKIGLDPAFVSHINETRKNPCELPSESELSAVNPRLPVHADHVRDLLDTSDKKDPFLACLMEPVDDPHYASGVVRTSTSAGYRDRFEPEDHEALSEVAIHISALLRREYTRQEEFVREYGSVEKLQTQLFHRLSRFGHAVAHFREFVRSESVPNEDTDKHLAELEEVLDAISRNQSLQPTLIRLKGLEQGRLNCEVFAQIIKDLLGGVMNSFSIDVAQPDQSSTIELGREVREQVLKICLAVEEVVANVRRHTDARGVRVSISADKGLVIQVEEKRGNEVGRAPENLRRQVGEWLPYAELAHGKKPGRGMKFLEDLTRELGLVAEVRDDYSGTKKYRVRLGMT